MTLPLIQVNKEGSLELAYRTSRPFFFSISILAPLPSVQGKHIQPVFKVVKLFLQDAIVDLQGGYCFLLGYGAFDFSLTLTLVLGLPIHRNEVDPV